MPQSSHNNTDTKLSDLNKNRNNLAIFRATNSPISNFMKIRSGRSQVVTSGQTDRDKGKD
jgi:hypothetical protein